MKNLLILLIFILFLDTDGMTNENITSLKFSNNLVVDKTFYIEEKSGYDTIVKFYLNNKKLRMFYVILNKSKLEETMTLDAKIDKNGSIIYTVFNRPTELKLQKITKNEYIVQEFHNHSKEYKNILVLQFSKPEKFAQ